MASCEASNSSLKQTLFDSEATANVHLENFSLIVKTLFSDASVTVYTHRKPLTLAAAGLALGMAGYVASIYSPEAITSGTTSLNSYPPAASKALCATHSAVPSARDQEIGHLAQLTLDQNYANPHLTFDQTILNLEKSLQTRSLFQALNK